MPHPMKKKTVAKKKPKTKLNAVMKALKKPVKLPFNLIKWV